MGFDGDLWCRFYSVYDIDEFNKCKLVGCCFCVIVEMIFDWGLFVFFLLILLIDEGWFYYRGCDVICFVDIVIFEEMVCFLWDCGRIDFFVDLVNIFECFDLYVINFVCILLFIECC